MAEPGKTSEGLEAGSELSHHPPNVLAPLKKAEPAKMFTQIDSFQLVAKCRHYLPLQAQLSQISVQAVENRLLFITGDQLSHRPICHSLDK